MSYTELREKWSIFDHTFENAAPISTTFLDFRGKKPASGRFSTTPNGKGVCFSPALLG
jgi:hypothetical protein